LLKNNSLPSGEVIQEPGWWSWGDNGQNFHACLCFNSLAIIARDCVKVKVIEILSLKPQDKERLNSHALKRFNDWQDRIMRELPHLHDKQKHPIRIGHRLEVVV
jgi:hypothetical protein